MALTDKLIAIADAIRTKTGNTKQMTLDQMALEINEISTSGANMMKDYLTARASDGYQFYYYKGSCETLEEFLKYSDTSSVTNMSEMFGYCSNLTTIPQIDTSSVTNMSEMFGYCSNLTTIPQIDTSSVINMNIMFGYCSNLTTIPQLDTSSVTNMGSMFKCCSNLTTIPQLDTSSVTNMSGMFKDCSNLTTIPQLDTSSVINMNNMFYNCSKLTECKLRNIKKDVIVGSGTSYGHLLTVESLLFMIGELVNTGVPKTFTIGSANLEKLASVYVKTITITDEMRAEDELIDQKLPFEVCESTDEGAMLVLTEYVTLKNWEIN